jgi:probable HAF family extracellular repeat protein
MQAQRCVPAFRDGQSHDLAAGTVSPRLNFVAVRLNGVEISPLKARQSGECRVNLSLALHLPFYDRKHSGMRKMIILTTLVVIGEFAAIHLANAAAYIFTQIDVPGAAATFASGINNAGQVVGFFQDSTGDHGFLDTGGSFTQIDVPGASDTIPNGINTPGKSWGTSAIARATPTAFSTPAAASPKSMSPVYDSPYLAALMTTGRSSGTSKTALEGRTVS